MMLDSEIQRTLLTQIINLAQFRGEHCEAVVALKEAIRSAHVEVVPPGPAECGPEEAS